MAETAVPSCSSCAFFQFEIAVKLDGKVWERGHCGSILPPAAARTVLGLPVLVLTAQVSSGMTCELWTESARPWIPKEAVDIHDANESFR